ncbi:MAG: NAD-dependent succinate-semialdehyde dehydrogenase, partial [Martelella sp.]
MTQNTAFSGYADPALHARGLFIGGNWEPVAGGIPVHDPSTGNRLVDVADAGIDDALRAVNAAEAAAEGWRNTPS